MRASSIKIWINVFIMGFASLSVSAQINDSLSVEKKWEVNGYLKDIQSLIFNRNYDSLVTGNLIHNRLNMRWKPTEKITAVAEFRTRLFWGEEVRLIPNFSSGIRNSHEAVNMSIGWIDKESIVMQTNVDRLWFEYRAKNWETRLGRQRVNWGISMLWNANDIFNTYNFLDFDYEERPGLDALKFRYHISGMSNIEVAVAGADRIDNTVAAIKYFTNTRSYDFQFLAGIYHEIATAGVGWSGSIQQAGFKGELQYFAAHKGAAAQLNATLETDYMFEKGCYVNVGILANSNGIAGPFNNWNLVNFQLSPQNLMPTKWNIVATVSKEITPLFSGNLSVIYAPGTNLMIALPSIKYNLATNIDFDLFWQSFFAEQGSGFESITHRGYIRLKWNF